MRLAILFGTVVVIASVLGWITYSATDSQTASYIVAVASMAVGILALIATMYVRKSGGIALRITATNVTESDITGVHRKGSTGEQAPISAQVDAKDITKGKITGVRED